MTSHHPSNVKTAPMLFSTPMVRALHAGTKTQTRRIIKPRGNHSIFGDNFGSGVWTDEMILDPGNDEWRMKDVPWTVGDRIWVREAWRVDAKLDHLPPREIPKTAIVAYEADYDGEPYDWFTGRGKYRHARFMPRWVSRTSLAVTEVRLQRLQDISADDACAEGLACLSKDGGNLYKYGVADRDGLPGRDNSGWPWICWQTDPRIAYAHLWDAINGEGAWAKNPWVTAISFSVEPKNIDR